MCVCVRVCQLQTGYDVPWPVLPFALAQQDLQRKSGVPQRLSPLSGFCCLVVLNVGFFPKGPNSLMEGIYPKLLRRFLIGISPCPVFGTLDPPGSGFMIVVCALLGLFLDFWGFRFRPPRR